MANQKRVDIQIGFSVNKSGLSEMQSSFQQIMALAEQPGKKMDAGFQQAAKTATTLNSILSKTFNTDLGSLNVTKFNQELSKSGLTLKDIKSQLNQAGNQGITAFNRLSQAILGTNQQIRQSNKALDQMFTTFKNTIRYGISSSIFNNFTNSIRQAFEFSKKLDTSLNDIRIVTNKSADSMAEFAQQANEAAKSMGASTLDYTNASLIYYQQGLSDAEVAARAETTIKAANVTGQTGEEVSEQLTAVWNGYKVTAEETEAYVDKLAAVAATTAANLEELSVGMSKVASAANAMGVDFDDLNAQIATIVSVTRQAPESVGTALKTIYARLGDLSVEGGVDEFGVSLGKVSEQMQMMGIQILDQEGNLRDMSSVIAEVAEKWGTWTEAQRQAAAVAMAGKRQYNNLIALFENWDMYTKALETSTNALGTLQNQQDIYMESTAAKLKTLKAAWQGLYDDAINEDEVNAGIEALTNLVEVFDNFIDSFGGGIKSIAGFGAIISSIFNKQIADNISAANQKIQVFKDNLALAQKNVEARALGTGGQLTATATPEDYAAEANTKIQLEYAEKIYQARAGLNQEQANSLINYQKEIGSLEQEVVLLQEQAKQTELTVAGNLKVSEVLKYNEQELEQLNVQYGEEEDKRNRILEKTKKQAEAIHEVLDTLVEQEDIYSEIEKINNKIANSKDKELKDFYNELEVLINEYKTTENRIDLEIEIESLIDKKVAKEKRSLDTLTKEEHILDRIPGIISQINKKRDQQNNIKQQADAMLELGNNATTVVQRITTVTSALGNMAMAWSSINSLIETWNNDQASFGDKIIQTFMTLGFTLPIVVTNFGKLNEVLGLSANTFRIFKTAEDAELVTRQARDAQIAIEITQSKARVAADEAEIAMANLKSSTRQSELRYTIAAITEKEAEAIATGKMTLAETKYFKKKAIANRYTKEETAAILAGVKAKYLESQATKSATVAQEGLNVAMKANPVGMIITGLMILVGVLSLVNKHFENLRENAKKVAEEDRKVANELNNEVQAHNELVTKYEELNQQYKEGNISKEDLWETTDQLIDAYGLEINKIAVLQGDYDALTASVKKAQKAEEEELLARNKAAIKSSTKSLVEQARKGINGINVNGDNFNIAMPENYNDAEAEDIYQNIFGTTDKNISFNKDDTKGIIEFYKNLLEYQKQLKDAGYEDSSDIMKEVQSKIDDFNNENAITDLIDIQEQSISSILDTSHLEEAVNKADFDSIINNLRTQLLEFLPEDEVEDKIESYVLKIQSAFADQFIINKEIEDRFGNQVNESLLKVFQQYDTDTQAELLKLHFDLTLDEEEGKQKLEEYVQYITGNQNGIYAIPVSFQDQINDTVLKGKDIAKGDWESLQNTLSPEANDILGDRTEFNNKSIGERIALLQQVNELTKENNLLAIQQYDKNKEASKEVTESLDNQIEGLQQTAQNWRDWAERTKTPEAFHQADEEIQKIQEEISELTSQKHEIEISLDMDTVTDNLVQSLVGDVMTEADQMKAAAESIGQGWKVAAEDVSTFAAAFPELMEGMKRLEDGSLQLNKEIVNNALEASQVEINENKRVAINAAETKIKQLKLELQFKEQQEEILTEALEGNKTAEETKQALADAAFDYQTQLLDNGLIAEADALTKAQIQEQTSVNGMINILGGLNDAINTIHHNFANMLTEDGEMLSLDAVAGSVKEITSSSVDTTKLNKNGFNTSDIDAMIEARNKLQQEQSQIKTQIASYEGFVSEMMNSVSEMDKAADRVQSGLAGKESKSGSSSKDKDKELKKLEEEFDRYWEIHKALDLIDRDLKKLNKDQENLYGKELIRSLKQENQLLENQAQLYEQLAAAQQAEAEELRGKLALSGVVFDASGAVVNYAEATAAALKAYNDAVQQYNAGLLDDAAFKIHEKAFEEFKKNLERYDTLFYQEMKETQEKLDDIRREILANNLKAWEVEIQLKLDFKELRRDWNDFINEVTKDFQSVFKDLRVDMKNMLDDAKTYIGEEGTIETVISAVHDVTGEIDKMMGGGESDMFESVSQAQEKLKELNEQLLDAGKALHDLYEQAYENLLDGIDQVADKFSKVIDRFERLNEEIEFNGKLIELLYGDEAYGLMSKYYEGMKNNILAQTESLKQQADFWEQEFKQSGASMNDFENWSEEQQKYYDNWMEAQSALNDMVLEYIQVLKDDYLNTIKDILKTLEKNLTGSSLDDVNEEWERISANADKYYDSVEKSYQIQTLANKIDQGINETNNLKAQQKLIALKEKEVGYLREKEKLTEYDIKAAELRYELALREIALEDAQQNKTSMKLTRNEQGNWSYQYVADENDIATKRQELLDTYNQLYQLASDAYEANLEAMQELEQKYLEKIEEITNNTVLSDEERNTQLKIAREQFEQDINDLVKENELYRQDLANAGSGMLLEIYNRDETAYEAMTDSERAMVDALIGANIEDFSDLEDKVSQNYQNIGDKSKEMMAETRADWTSSAQDLTRLAGDLDKYIQQAYNDIEKANNNYQKAVDECARIVERDFSEQGIAGAIQKAEQETDNLRDKTRELTEASHSYLNDLRSYVDMIADAWRSVQDQIMAAINLIDEYLRKVGEANAAAQQQATIGGAGDSGGGTGTGGSGNGGSNGSNNENRYIEQDDPNGVPGTKGLWDTEDHKWVKIWYDGDTTSSSSPNNTFLQKRSTSGGFQGGTNYIRAYATGGYTGSWGNASGRLAMLHEKELVLNADDTKNFLSGINTIRNMVASNGSIENAVLKAAANMAYSLSNITPGTFAGGVNNNNSSTENVFNITAEFPNANNVDDIRQAILTLPNIASQYVNSNLR